MSGTAKALAKPGSYSGSDWLAKLGKVNADGNAPVLRSVGDCLMPLRIPGRGRSCRYALAYLCRSPHVRRRSIVAGGTLLEPAWTRLPGVVTRTTARPRSSGDGY
ncbi:hypothetical protein [Sphingomonas faeni]|uniref:hypothetical protein n=1 Tax=Sphingomonas faeni TaxID=185950 RepID=UPI0027D9108E|nr:hypothetical protein [Sphingomonas faeni]